MADIPLIQDAIAQARRSLREELAGMMRAIEQVPAKFIPNVVTSMPSYLDMLDLLDRAYDETEDLAEETTEIRAGHDRSLRRQKHWRIIACRAILGELRGDDLKAQAFRDFITEPPAHEALDKELGELADRLEALEAATEEFGELRSIVLDT